MTTVVTNHLEQFLDDAAASYAKDRPTRLRTHSFGPEHKQILEEADVLNENKRQFLALLRFIRSCKVVVGKPRVYKTRNNSHFGYLQYKQRYILPNVYLTDGNRKITIESIADVSEGRLGAGQLTFPKIYERWGDISLYRFGYPGWYSQQDELVKAFLNDGGIHWQEIVRLVQKAWDDTKSNLDSFVEAHFDAKAEGDRVNFRRNLLNLLNSKYSGLADVPAEGLLAMFQLGYEAVEQYARFVAQNKSCIPIVKLEDIIEAQQEAQVRKVMDS